MRIKVGVVKQSMLRSVREEAGLGSPPNAFYTNASESLNRPKFIIKGVNYLSLFQN